MNDYFPASYSTLCPQALGSLITKEYGIPSVQCRLIIRGVGDTYLTETAGNRFILRVYRSSHRSHSQIDAETALLIALKNSGVSVSYPVADLHGKLIQTLEAVEGKRYAVLFTYAPGQTISRLNDAQLRNLGHQVARFHNISSVLDIGNSRWDYDLETMLFRPLEMLKEAFKNNPEDFAWWQQAANQVNERLRKIDTSSFSAGYCHFDLLPKNFHFDGDAVTLFDFDFLGYGWLINDIMIFWQHLCLDVHFGRMTQDEADKSYAVFVSTYKEYRALTDQELSAVPYLSLGFWLFYMGFHTTHDQFYQFVQPDVLKARTGIIRQMMSRYWSNR